MDPKRPTTENSTSFAETHRDPRSNVPVKLAALRFKLGQKAKQEPGFRFYALYGHLQRVDVLETAFATVAASDGSQTAGVDGITIDHIVNAEDGVQTLLAGIRADLHAKTYRHQPVMRVYIPKANGKMRPLGIPTIRDRVVQTAVLLVLEPIFDADFLDCSYGFRSGRSAHGAIEAIRTNLREGRTAVYDADLQGYFDSIPHDKLMKGLEQRISDGSMLRLIREFLRAPIQEGKGPPTRPGSGTPQGGVISPLLANSFLHWFDKSFFSKTGPGTWAKARLVRYADDFVVMAKRIDRRIQQWIEHIIEGRLGLVINREKTKTLHVKDEPLDFLGYRFCYHRSFTGLGGRYLRIEPAPKSTKRLREKIHDLTSSSHCYEPVQKVIDNVNAVLRGWLNYFSKGHPAKARWQAVRYAEDRIVNHLRRRSQRPYRPPDGTNLYAHIHELGLMEMGKQRD